MSTPAKQDITVYQGQTFVQPLVWKDNAQTPINLTGFTARLQIRRNVRSPDVLHSMTTENGGITLGDLFGTIELTIPAATSSLFAFRSAVYDLELIAPGGAVTRLMEGEVTVSPEVTR